MRADTDRPSSNTPANDEPPQASDSPVDELDRCLRVSPLPFLAIAVLFLSMLATGMFVKVPVHVPLAPVAEDHHALDALVPPGHDPDDLEGRPATVHSAGAEHRGTVSAVHTETAPTGSGTVMVATVSVQEAPPSGLTEARVLVRTGERALITDLLSLED